MLTEQYRRQIEEHLDAAVAASRQIQMRDEELLELLKKRQKA